MSGNEGEKRWIVAVKTQRIRLVVIPGLTRNPDLFQLNTPLDAGSSRA
jgi:hypothetical protein